MGCQWDDGALDGCVKATRAAVDIVAWMGTRPVAARDSVRIALMAGSVVSLAVMVGPMILSMACVIVASMETMWAALLVGWTPDGWLVGCLSSFG